VLRSMRSNEIAKHHLVAVSISATMVQPIIYGALGSIPFAAAITEVRAQTLSPEAIAQIG
jgi:hypothetical protein